MLLRQILLWLPMIVIAFANAALRELFLNKYFTELRANQFSTLTLILFCSVYIWLVFPSLNIQDQKHALFVGALWTSLTVMFEFSMGLLTHKSWSFMLNNYNLLQGHIWPLFLIWLFFLPVIVSLLRIK